MIKLRADIFVKANHYHAIEVGAAETLSVALTEFKAILNQLPAETDGDRLADWTRITIDIIKEDKHG